MCARVTSTYMEFTFTLDQNRNLSFHLSQIFSGKRKIGIDEHMF